MFRNFNKITSRQWHWKLWLNRGNIFTSSLHRLYLFCYYHTSKFDIHNTLLFISKLKIHPFLTSQKCDTYFVVDKSEIKIIFFDSIEDIGCVITHTLSVRSMVRRQCLHRTVSPEFFISPSLPYTNHYYSFWHNQGSKEKWPVFGSVRQYYIRRKKWKKRDEWKTGMSGSGRFRRHRSSELLNVLPTWETPGYSVSYPFLRSSRSIISSVWKF